MQRFVCIDDDEHVFWIPADAPRKMHVSWDDGLSCPWCDAWAVPKPAKGE